MKFWIKLILGIIVIISIVLSFSRYIVVRQSFIQSIEESANQNQKEHNLERYNLENSIISNLQM